MARAQHTGTQIVEALSAAIKRLAGCECGGIIHWNTFPPEWKATLVFELQLAQCWRKSAGERVGACACYEQSYGDEQLREGVFDASRADVEAVR